MSCSGVHLESSRPDPTQSGVSSEEGVRDIWWITPGKKRRSKGPRFSPLRQGRTDVKTTNTLSESRGMWDHQL